MEKEKKRGKEKQEKKTQKPQQKYIPCAAWLLHRRSARRRQAFVVLEHQSLEKHVEHRLGLLRARRYKGGHAELCKE